MNPFNFSTLVSLFGLLPIVLGLYKLWKDKSGKRWTLFSTIYKWISIVLLLVIIASIFVAINTYAMFFVDLELFILGVPYIILSLIYFFTNNTELQKIIKKINDK